MYLHIGHTVESISWTYTLHLEFIPLVWVSYRPGELWVFHKVTLVQALGGCPCRHLTLLISTKAVPQHWLGQVTVLIVPSEVFIQVKTALLLASPCLLEEDSPSPY